MDFCILKIRGVSQLNFIENRCFMENVRKLNIYICEYDDTNMFVVVKRGNDNLFMAMGICQFVDEMEYWDMSVKSGVLNGENGYIFSKNIEIEDIKMEIERFVVHNIL